MLQITANIGIMLNIVLLIMVAGCSDARKNGSEFNTDTGKHVNGWVPQGHATTVATSGSTTSGVITLGCTECHGSDLNGGIAQVSCAGCHLGGAFSIHPTNWQPVFSTHGPYANTNGTDSCANQYCHGTALTGVTDSGPSCNVNSGTGGCHSIPFDPATVICGACHGIPPTGNLYPDIAGKHAQHAALGSSIICGACHYGSDGVSGTTFHYNNVVETALDATYNAQSGGTAAFSAASGACSTISCHGGQTTPNWLTGTLDVNTQCTACHAYNVVQYNSYKSGQHDKHVNQEKIACTSCHDTTLLAVNHFTTLNTSAMEGPAKNTIKTSIQYNGTSCAHPCHDPENWN